MVLPLPAVLAVVCHAYETSFQPEGDGCAEHDQQGERDVCCGVEACAEAFGVLVDELGCVPDEGDEELLWLVVDDIPGEQTYDWGGAHVNVASATFEGKAEGDG